MGCKQRKGFKQVQKVDGWPLDKKPGRPSSSTKVCEVVALQQSKLTKRVQDRKVISRGSLNLDTVGLDGNDVSNFEKLFDFWDK